MPAILSGLLQVTKSTTLIHQLKSPVGTEFTVYFVILSSP